MGPLQQAGVFLIDTLFSLYILLLMLRFILQMVRADFYNPVSLFVVKLTNKPLVPLRRVIPGWGGVDFALLLLLLGFTITKVALTFCLEYHRIPGMSGLLIWSIGDLLTLSIKIFFFAVLIQIILSWVSPMSYNPFTNILNHLTSPLLNLAKRYIPPFGGLDLSPLPVMLGLQLLIILIAKPITHIGLQLV